MTLVESFSGIRGIYGVDLTDEIIIKYAQAYSEYLNKKYENPKIVIGRDTRPSGERVFNILVENLNCEIVDLGILPTPIIENAVRTFDCVGGIIITASHNEPEFNGFKFLDSDGAILRPREIDYVINLVHENPYNNINKISKKVENRKEEAVQEYIELLKNILKTNEIKSGVRILVDPNGGAGIISESIFGEFAVNAEYINMNEGEFNRLVEPKEESLKYLRNKIIENKCDFAIGFDCDADRVEILLDNGELVSGNQILALIADEIFSNSNSPQKSIVVNDATSYLVKEISEKYSVSWEEVEVGEINVVDKMIELDSQVGGEGSNGGVIIPPTKCRDGVLTVLLLLRLIKQRNKSLKELIDKLPKYYYIKEKIKLFEDFSLIKERIKDYYIENDYEIIITGDITGGLKAIKDDSWVWFRQSKTEDKVLRIIVDSKKEDIALKLLEEAKGLLK